LRTNFGRNCQRLELGNFLAIDLLDNFGHKIEQKTPQLTRIINNLPMAQKLMLKASIPIFLNRLIKDFLFCFLILKLSCGYKLSFRSFQKERKIFRVTKSYGQMHFFDKKKEVRGLGLSFFKPITNI